MGVAKAKGREHVRCAPPGSRAAAGGSVLDNNRLLKMALMEHAPIPPQALRAEGPRRKRWEAARTAGCRR